MHWPDWNLWVSLPDWLRETWAPNFYFYKLFLKFLNAIAQSSQRGYVLPQGWICFSCATVMAKSSGSNTNFGFCKLFCFSFFFFFSCFCGILKNYNVFICFFYWQINQIHAIGCGMLDISLWAKLWLMVIHSCLICGLLRKAGGLLPEIFVTAKKMFGL